MKWFMIAFVHRKFRTELFGMVLIFCIMSHIIWLNRKILSRCFAAYIPSAKLYSRCSAAAAKRLAAAAIANEVSLLFIIFSVFIKMLLSIFGGVGWAAFALFNIYPFSFVTKRKVAFIPPPSPMGSLTAYFQYTYFARPS